MIETVLVPTDGSDEATVAVEHGVELAARFGATVHVLHVVDVRTMETASQSDNTRAREEDLVTSTADEATQHSVDDETVVVSSVPVRPDRFPKDSACLNIHLVAPPSRAPPESRTGIRG